MEQSLSDRDAVFRLKRGDEQALIVLYDRYADRVYRFAIRLVGRAEDAEEIVADAFLQAFRHARDYREEGTFSGWLFRIARNLCLQRLRRPNRLRLISLDDLLDDECIEVGCDPGVALPLVATVQAALRQLPPEYRRVLTMRDIDGLTNSEAAQAMGRSAPATKSLHFRARQALRDAVVKELQMEGMQ